MEWTDHTQITNISNCSEKHGESFVRLVKSVDRAGPCLIVIETTSDRVFGAFASQGFICGPRYTGDSQCFLFEDRQKLHIYSATGYNNNFGYLNSGQASLPSGIVRLHFETSKIINYLSYINSVTTEFRQK